MSLSDIKMHIESKGFTTTVTCGKAEVTMKRSLLLRLIDSISCCLSPVRAEKLHHFFGYSKLHDDSQNIHYVSSDNMRKTESLYVPLLRASQDDLPKLDDGQNVLSVVGSNSGDVSVPQGKAGAVFANFMNALNSVKTPLPVPEYKENWDATILNENQKGHLLTRLGAIGSDPTPVKGLRESINLKKDLGGAGSLGGDVSPDSDNDFDHLCHQILFLMTPVGLGVPVKEPRGSSVVIQQPQIDTARKNLFEVLPTLSMLKRQMIVSFIKKLPETEKNQIVPQVRFDLERALQI